MRSSESEETIKRVKENRSLAADSFGVIHSNRKMGEVAFRVAENGSVTQWPLVIICAAIMLCEGFDLVVYGNIIPLLIEDGSLGITKAIAGNIGSMVFLGMLLGGLATGRINQSFSPSKVLTYGIVWFSAAVLATSVAGNALIMGTFRFLTGLGLGFVLPTALSVARSACRDEKAALAISVVMAGVPAGGLLAAFSVSLLGAGWRVPLALAGVLGFAIVLFLRRVLRGGSKGFHNQAAAVSRTKPDSWMIALSRKRLVLLIFCALATLADLFSYYGVTTWLTQLMNEFNLPMQNSLQLTMALNLGAIVGSILVALISLSFDIRYTAMVCGIVAGICLLGIASHPSSSFLLFLLVVLIGTCAISAQNLLNTVISNSFPAKVRSSAFGITTGVGRLGAILAPSVGGWVLQAGWGPEPVLACFGVASFVGVLMLGACTKKRIIRSMKEDMADLSPSR
jgi:AAHS family benzoate transporter-like MFS transporter